MKKYFSLLAVALVAVMIFSPHKIFADDGAMIDVDELLTYSIEIDNPEGEIGEYIEYSLILKNNTSKIIILYDVNGIFSYSGIDYPNELDPIKPGKKIVINFRGEIPYDIEWYKIGEEFYFDLFPSITYGVENYGYFDSWQHEPKPIKITNLFDGSSFASISNIEEDGMFIYPDIDKDDLLDSKEGYYKWGNISSTATFINMSNKTLYDFHYDYREEKIDKFMPNEKFEHEFWVYSQQRTDRDMTNSSKLNYTAIFTIDGKYYGVSEMRVYKSVYLPVELNLDVKIKKFDGRYKSIEDEFENYMVTVTNKGSETINGLYVGFNETYKEFYFKNYIGRLDKGESQNFYVHHKSDEDIECYFGIIGVDSIYFKSKYTNTDFSNSNEGNYYELNEEVINLSVEPEEESHEEEASPEVTPTPTLEPTSAPTPIKAQELETTPSSIIIESVEEKSSIPVWVFPVLGLAVIANILTVIFLRKKSKEKD